jgi:hypothetical protein
MEPWLRHLRWRELRLLALVLANLFAIAGFLGGGGQQAEVQIGGWRRIDLEAVLARMRTGALSDREAQWYRPADQAEKR